MTARDLIKQHEGLRLQAYPDPATGDEPWTIGYGHTKGVYPGDSCTKERAEKWLDEDIAEAAKALELVKVPLNEFQRDALISFVFNVGKQAFADSTMLKLLNQGNYVAAANQFTRWIHAGGKVMPGLVKRRNAEKQLFLSDQPKEQPMSIAGTVLINALPTLINNLPELANIFRKPDVASRNVEAVAKVGSILVEATGATNVQEAVERVQADPKTAAEANDALRLNRADIMDTIERLAKMDEESVQAAREFALGDEPVYKRWHFVHILSLLFVVLGGGAAIFVLASSDDPTERVMALQTLLIVGFASVAGFWLGSSRSSQVKDLLK